MTKTFSSLPSALISRAEAAYLGLAIGDSLGASVEFMTPGEIRRTHGVHRDLRGGGWLNIKAGQVTDDTTMALALGSAILDDGGEVKALSCAHAFDRWMRGKPIDIGNTVRRNLIAFRRTGNPTANLCDYDAGNGAAMRILPVALATLNAEVDAVCAAVRAQSHVTHNNPVSDTACEFIVLATQDFIRGEPLRTVYRRHINPLVCAHPEFTYRGRRRENPSGWIVETLQAVLQSIMHTDSFESCLIDVVNRGGDADTTGAIAGMLAGACYGLQSIPPRWLNALDPSVKTACRNQARALVASA